ncbi:MAG: transposase [Arenimonas sp.]|nr:transposase [Arenimonas sp.]
MESEHHLLLCARYIDLNPVRARLTDNACSYRWSSCAALCGLRHDSLLTLHASQLATGPTVEARGLAHRALLDEGVPDEELQAIRLYLQQQRAWGRDDFRAMVEATTRRFATPRPAHRPVDGKNK